MTFLPRREPSFFVGDFNGDGSQDLAVIVKLAAGRLDDLNSEFANWILEGPRELAQVITTSVLRSVSKRKAIRVEQKDLLLAVIHGYGAAGWRNPVARQTYLLRNGGRLDPQPYSDSLRRQHAPLLLPERNSVVISETLAGEEGFLHWTGAGYAWYH